LDRHPETPSNHLLKKEVRPESEKKNKGCISAGGKGVHGAILKKKIKLLCKKKTNWFGPKEKPRKPRKAALLGQTMEKGVPSKVQDSLENIIPKYFPGRS